MKRNKISMKRNKEKEQNPAKKTVITISKAIIGTVTIGTAFCIILCLTGFFQKEGSQKTFAENTVKENHTNADYPEKSDTLALNLPAITELYYETGKEENAVQALVTGLGSLGYAAVDSKNQINMTHPEQVQLFCEQAEAKKEAALTIISVSYDNGFTAYELQTKDGSVDVRQQYFICQNGQLINTSVGSYTADTWNYTGNYLFFGGKWYSEMQYILSMSGTEEYAALRVQPLDDICREANRTYIQPIGYGKNNLFLLDWSEEKFGALNLYDLFDKFYPMIYGKPAPYPMDNNLGTGAVYRISEKLFENAIQTYLPIDRAEIRSRTTYFSEDGTYEYKPRGFYELEAGNPYSEVVNVTENQDGTVTLTVNAVYPKAYTDRLFVHEAVIRPLDGGSFQYISNRIVASAGENEMWWHTERLTGEEWKEIYGFQSESLSDISSDFQFDFPFDDKSDASSDIQSYELPISEAERKEAEEDCKKVMSLLYADTAQERKGEILSDETALAMQKKIKRTGCPVSLSMPYSNMENHEAMDAFLKQCIEEKSGFIVTYKICHDGRIRRDKYRFDGTNMDVLSAISAWNEKNQPVMTYISHTRIEEWKYTEKGWFGYTLCVPKPPETTEIIDGSCLIRVKPMTDMQREYSENFVFGLGYQGNNLLRSDWDTEHLERLDYNGLYEYLYRMKYQESFLPEKYPDGIPKDTFERLIMEYLPITSEQIQAYAVYDAEKQTYPWAELNCFNYAPAFFEMSIPEVTKITEKEDGTLTLTVDAVCDMVLCDDALITHELTIKKNDDGTFFYLGNKVLNDGMANMGAYSPRMIGMSGNTGF